MVPENLSESFVFIQMNFWSGRLFYPIDSFFKRERGDIFSAQEMLSGPHDLSPDFMTAESLVQMEHFDRFMMGNSTTSHIEAQGVNYPMVCATFTKGEITCEFENKITLYRNPDDPSEYERLKANYYALLHTTLRLKDGAMVHILNLHGRLVKGEQGRFQSEVADYNFARIAEYAATLKGPIILSGDFNLVKEATSLQALKDIGLTNLNDVYNISEARNEFSWRPTEAVAHVFINDQVIVNDYKVARDNVSDHLPLVLNCRVTYNR
jgi:endonuclease/exonuclease/phosphatase family metal-dependent hydrolase